MKHVFSFLSLITFICIAGTAHATLIYELKPAVYKAAPGETVHTFATVTNTGPETLYYAYSFLDPGTVPIAAGTGQLPPLILDAGERVFFTGATITTTTTTKPGTYTFREGVAYHPGVGVPDFVEASDVGILIVVPEPWSNWLFGCGLLALRLALRYPAPATSTARGHSPIAEGPPPLNRRIQ